MVYRQLRIEHYIDREQAVLRNCGVHAYLSRALATNSGRKKFAEVFYFIRVQFVRHNFMIGAKCPYDESYWRGVVTNLIEELGGKKSSISHNELYRRFVRSVGGAPESERKQPEFAREFNRRWESYIEEHAVEESLFAITIYEALDNPDYEMLLSVLKKNYEEGMDLSFFAVHAAAQHTGLFMEFLKAAGRSHMRDHWEQSAAEFVFSTQEKMWKGLITELSHCCT